MCPIQWGAGRLPVPLGSPGLCGSVHVGASPPCSTDWQWQWRWQKHGQRHGRAFGPEQGQGPATPAPELCAGAFELALARAHLRSSIRYSALLEAMHLDPDCPPASPPQAPTTGPQGPSPATAPSPTTTPAAPEAARREHWAQTLAQLAPYPTTTIPGTDGPVFAAADFPPPRPNVTDLGMVFPAYDPQIHTDPVLRGIARRTAVHQLRAGQSATTPWFLNAAARVLPRDEADGLVPGFDAAVSLLPNGLPKDWANELIGFYTAAINSFLVQVRVSWEGPCAGPGLEVRLGGEEAGAVA